MIIFKENKNLSEGANIGKIKELTISNIVKGFNNDSLNSSQRSSDRKVFLGECLGALTAVGVALNPMGDYWPGRNEPSNQLDRDIKILADELNNLILKFNRVALKDYKDQKR